MSVRKARIAQAFAGAPASYDSAAGLQAKVAARLAERLGRLSLPAGPRILEIGCGTGLFSAHLANALPDADLLLTDIAEPMLAACRARLGGRGAYQLLDGENPALGERRFDLIAASLVFQWFENLPGALAGLAGLLAPGGRLIFATLLDGSLREWSDALRKQGAETGTPAYPNPAAFPWPQDFVHLGEEDVIMDQHPDALSFLRSLRDIGATEPRAGYRPLSPGQLRKILAAETGSAGYAVRYHLLFGALTAP